MMIASDARAAAGMRLRRGTAILAALGAGAVLSGCSLRVLDPAGPVAAGSSTILLNALAVMLCIVVPTMLATVAFAWWFRAANARAQRLPDWSFSGRIEIVTWSVPLLAIAFLGGVAWIGSHDLDPAKPLQSSREPLGGGMAPIEVQVVSLDWKWLFLYPGGRVASVNRLVLPTGTPVHLSLTSGSVWDSFFVPQLGSMIYTMRNMTTQLNLRADREGRFLGLSSHLSGDGFADMTFEAEAVSPAAFADWVKEAQAAPAALGDATYEALSRQSAKVPPTLYRLTAADLFARIVSGGLPPGPGPDAGRPNRDVTPRSDHAGLQAPLCASPRPAGPRTVEASAK